MVVSLIVLAIAGIELVRYNRDMAVMFVVDYSDSVGPNAKSAAEKYIQNAIKERRPNDKWGVVVFGRERLSIWHRAARRVWGKSRPFPLPNSPTLLLRFVWGWQVCRMGCKSVW